MRKISLLLDKSALHNLKASEMAFLSHFVNFIIPPILVREMIGDLSPTRENGHDAKIKVQNLFRKFPLNSTGIHADFRDIRDGSLMGKQIEKIHCPFYLSIGSSECEANFDTQQNKLELLKKWQDGDFSEDDVFSAEEWRHESKVDLNVYKNGLLKIPALQSLSSLTEVRDKLHYLNFNIEDGWQVIYWYLQRIGSMDSEAIKWRWDAERTWFQEFANYAYYCFLVEQVFYQGLSSSLIPSSNKDKAYVDLQYAYYFPFIEIFSSSDRLHEAYFAFARLDQKHEFLSGLILKEQLAAWVNWCEERQISNPIHFLHHEDLNQNILVNLIRSKAFSSL